MGYHHGDLRNALLEAAERALDEKGEVPSLRALAEACGVSHGAPYRHFSDVDDLRGWVAAKGFEGLAAAVRAATDGVEPPATRLGAGCAAYVAWGLAHPARYALMFGGSSPVPGHDGCRAASGEAFAKLVEGCAACGAPDPERAANAAWAAIHGVVDLGRQAIAGEEVGADVVEMLVRWVTALGR